MNGIWQKGRCKWVYVVHFLVWVFGWLVFALLIGGVDRFLSLLTRDTLQLSLFVLSFFIPFALCLSWFGEDDDPPGKSAR